MVVLGTPGLVAAFLGARQVVPLALGVAGVFFFFTCVLLGALMGLQARRRLQEQRERESYGAMLVMIAAQIRDQADSVLERIVAKGGPAGEAAVMVLQGRKGKGEKGKGKSEALTG